MQWRASTIDTAKLCPLMKGLAVQIKTVQYSLGKSTGLCAPPCLSEVPATLPLEQIQCQSDRHGPFSPSPGRSSSAFSGFHASLLRRSAIGRFGQTRHIPCPPSVSDSVALRLQYKCIVPSSPAWPSRLNFALWGGGQGDSQQIRSGRHRAPSQAGRRTD